MSNLLPPVPYKATMADAQGITTAIWSDWFKQLFARVGGHIAESNTELKTDITDLSPKLVPTGAMLDFGGSSAPAGFLLCDGSAVSRATYAALFAVIGTAFGAGDGSTTFNVPPSGKFTVGKDSGTFTPIGATGGAESVNLPSHAHSVSLTTGTPSAAQNVGNVAGVNVASSGHTHSVSGNTGSPTTSPAIATLPPYLVVQRIIKW